MVTVLVLVIALAQIVMADAGKKKQLAAPPLAKSSIIVGGELPGGTYTVGGGGYFPTLDSAFRRLRGGGISGPVTFTLIDTLYIAPPADSGSFSLTGPISGADSTNRITIRPAWNTAVTLRGNGPAVLMFHNVSFITIDGTALEGSTRLRVHAQTDLAHSWNDGIDFAGDCDHVEVLNLHISTDNITRETDGIGMWAEETGGPDHSLVSGVRISSGHFGIYVSSSLNGNNRPQGIILRNNQIGGPSDSLMAIGIQTVETDGIIIEGNHVEKLRNTMSGPSRYYQFGINAYNSRNVSIRNNTIHDLAASYPNTAIEGILASGDAGYMGSNIWIYNNVIFDVKNRAGAGNTSAVAGIRIWRNNDVYMYHNSVFLSPTNDIASGLGSAAIYIDASVTHPVIQNNIAANQRTASGETAVALRIDVDGQIADYNALSVAPRPGAILARRASELHAGLAEWKGTGNDAHSSEILPAFRDALLHIDSTAAGMKALNGKGVPIPGVVTDHDARLRSERIPDIGAYEFDMIIRTHNGKSWKKDPNNPVLAGGVQSAWNTHVFNPSVLYNADSSRFEMWFTAVSGSNAAGVPRRVGFATSSDGSTWAMYPGPVLQPTPGSWDSYSVDAPRVIRENGSYRMWYTSYTSSGSTAFIGHATSPDGITWTKYASNPIFGPGNSDWEATGPGSCWVLPSPQGGYDIWYDAYDAAVQSPHIGHATSVDGISWRRDSLRNPVLRHGSLTEWDETGALYPIVLKLNTSSTDSAWYMWYVGSRTGGSYRAGLATSDDGISGWQKSETNPVLVPSGSGWDGTYAGAGTVLLRDSTLHMFYDGALSPTSSNYFKIGHATSPITDVPMERTPAIPSAFALEHNYPNPFNPSTTIRFSLIRSGVTDLTVYDLLGRTVTTLVNETMVPGTYNVHWDAQGCASGIYFYRLRSGEFTETKRMLLLK
jgi:predicted GH43/DUF377 family glycosyl hydrolase